jgi:hypothetical protein
VLTLAEDVLVGDRGNEFRVVWTGDRHVSGLP